MIEAIHVWIEQLNVILGSQSHTLRALHPCQLLHCSHLRKLCSFSQVLKSEIIHCLINNLISKVFFLSQFALDGFIEVQNNDVAMLSLFFDCLSDVHLFVFLGSDELDAVVLTFSVAVLGNQLLEVCSHFSHSHSLLQNTGLHDSTHIVLISSGLDDFLDLSVLFLSLEGCLFKSFWEIVTI